MKKFITAIGFVQILTIQLITSQNYEPLVRENAHWVVASSNSGLPWYYEYFREYFTNGDTTLVDKIYKKVYRYQLEPLNGYTQPPYLRIGSPVLYGLLREDTLEKRVYGIQIYIPGDCFFGMEEMLFDFSISQSDTLELCQAFLGPISFDTIYYENVFSYYRKVFKMGQGWYQSNEMIEGIGTTYGLFESIGQAFKYSKGGQEVLICYTMGNISACDIITSNHSNPATQIRIYPNPVKGGFLYINIPEAGYQNLKLIISDMLGNMVYESINEVWTDRLDITSLKSGVFVIQCFNNDELILTEKIIKL